MPQDTESRRRELYRLLGDLPDRSREISARKVAEQEREAYILEKLVLDINGIEEVPAYFLRPQTVRAPVPAVLFNHAHGGEYHIGKEEVIAGRQGQQKPPYGEALTREGYAVLCIDAWAFGERRGRTESEIFKEMLWSGQVMWGMMVYDSIRAIDYLMSRPEVDSGRIATMGISMGSTMAWWLAALDTRVKVCVDICCLTDFHALIDRRGLDGHGIYYYVPNLLKHFTTADINALIAPRPHLSLAGNSDPLTPPKGLDRVDAELKKVYAEAGAPEAWKLIRYGCGHMETAAMRAEALAFLRKWL
jgi:dienelactone hydrolase